MIIIREYSDVDAKVLWDIHFHTIRNINIRDYSQQQVEAWAPDHLDLSLWKRRMNELFPFIAEIDGVIVGYADLQPRGLIDHLFCHHEYQRQGVGKALMTHVFELSALREIQRLYSEVSITARPFYEHFGFDVVHAQKVEIRGQQLTNFLMEKCFRR